MAVTEWRAERNRQSLARLTKALPPIFPAPVLAHALGRPFIPPTPRLAVDAYWRAHPIARRPARAKRWRPAAVRRRAGMVARIDARGRPAGHLSRTARALSRRTLQSWSGPLLRLWSAGLSPGMALRSLGQGAEPECRVACRMCHRVAAVERAERFCASAQTAADAALRANRRPPLENRRGRSSDAAVPGLARASEYLLARASGFLGRTESASDQQRRSRGEVRRGGAIPRPTPGGGAVAQFWRLTWSIGLLAHQGCASKDSKKRKCAAQITISFIALPFANHRPFRRIMIFRVIIN